MKTSVGGNRRRHRLASVHAKNIKRVVPEDTIRPGCGANTGDTLRVFLQPGSGHLAGFRQTVKHRRQTEQVVSGPHRLRPPACGYGFRVEEKSTMSSRLDSGVTFSSRTLPLR